MYKNPARCTNYKPTNTLSSSKMTPSHEATPSPHVIILMKKCNGRRTVCCVLAGATISKTSPVQYRQLYRLGLASCEKARKLLKHFPATCCSEFLRCSGSSGIVIQLQTENSEFKWFMANQSKFWYIEEPSETSWIGQCHGCRRYRADLSCKVVVLSTWCFVQSSSHS